MAALMGTHELNLDAFADLILFSSLARCDGATAERAAHDQCAPVPENGALAARNFPAAVAKCVVATKRSLETTMMRSDSKLGTMNQRGTKKSGRPPDAPLTTAAPVQTLTGKRRQFGCGD
jgi:hypothetical protein